MNRRDRVVSGWRFGRRYYLTVEHRPHPMLAWLLAPYRNEYVLVYPALEPSYAVDLDSQQELPGPELRVLRDLMVEWMMRGMPGHQHDPPAAGDTHHVDG